MAKHSDKAPKAESTAVPPSKPTSSKTASKKPASEQPTSSKATLPPPAESEPEESSEAGSESDEQGSEGSSTEDGSNTATLSGAGASVEAGDAGAGDGAGNTGAGKQKAGKPVKGIRTPEQTSSPLSEPESIIYTVHSKSHASLRKRKHSAMDFEAPTSALISSAHSFLKDTPKLEGSHDFQPWLSDITTAIQIINCTAIIESDTPPGETHGTRTATANRESNRAWTSAQAAVKGLILSSVGREARKSIQTRTTGFQMLTELKSRFTRKGGSRVAEIHASLRSTTLETSTDIHDFAAKLRTFNDELAAIHDDYALRKWEMNLHFVDNLTDAYDSFTTGLLTADNDFIEIGNEMDWQTLVNKAAEVESKAKARGARTSAYKASLESRISHPAQGEVNALAANSAKATLDEAKKALIRAKESAFCKGCQLKGHFDEECWKQGNAPMPERVKKRKAAAAEQKKKEEANKKAKTDQVAANYANDDTEIVYACPALLDTVDAFVLPPNIPKSKGYHHYIDSGAGRHLSGHEASFTSFTKLDRPITVAGFAGQRIVTFKGTMKINISVKGKPQALVIQDVLFASGLPFSLLSVKAFGRKGLRTTFDDETCEIMRKDTGQVIATGESLTETDLYRLVLSDDTPSGTHFDAYHAGIKDSSPTLTDDDLEPPAKAKEINIVTAHRRLGHLSEGHLRRLPQVSKGLTVKGTFQFCEECALAKQTRRNFTDRPKRTKERLGKIHMDLSGPHPTSVRGERYFLLLLDEATRKRWVIFLKQKSDTPGALRAFLTQMETQTDLKVKCWHSDNGGEFISKVMEEINKTNGIIHEPTAPYNPEQNGSAERSMYTIWDGARALFKDTDLDINLWPEMVRTKIYLLNLSPTNALEGITPYEAWEHSKPDLSHLRVIGSVGYKSTPRALLKTKDDRAEKCILLGYGGTNQYRVFNITKQRVELVRDIRFHEDDHRPPDKIVPNISANHDPPPDPLTEEVHRGQKRSQEEDPNHDGPSKRTRSKGPWDEAMFVECQKYPEPNAASLLHEIRATIAKLEGQQRDPATSISALLASVEVYQSIAEEVLRDPIDCDPQEPTNYKKAKASPQAPKWDTSMIEELQSLAENETWTLVPRPAHRKVLGGK